MSAYCAAHTTLPSNSYPIQARSLSIAEGIASFAIKNMIEEDAEGNIVGVSRTWRKGERGPRAQADDHAFFIQGMLTLTVLNLLAVS